MLQPPRDMPVSVHCSTTMRANTSGLSTSFGCKSWLPSRWRMRTRKSLNSCAAMSLMPNTRRDARMRSSTSSSPTSAKTVGLRAAGTPMRVSPPVRAPLQAECMPLTQAVACWPSSRVAVCRCMDARTSLGSAALNALRAMATSDGSASSTSLTKRSRTSVARKRVRAEGVMSGIRQC